MAGKTTSSGSDRYLERWQSRTREPTPYEDALGDALESAFNDGITALPDLVQRLNEVNVKAPDGRDWTEETFERELRLLGV